MSKIKKLTVSAMLLAILVILSRFVSIKTEILVISVSFIPIILSAIWLGPAYSTLIAGLGDFIGATLFPFGPYFPGFTLSAALTGAIYGLFLYNGGKPLEKKKLLLRLVISSVLELSVIGIFLTSLWIYMLYGKAFMVVVSGRVVEKIAMMPIQVIVIYGLEAATRPIVRKYL